jgi:hypothetical protein
MAIVSNVITTSGNIIHSSSGSTAITVLYICNRGTTAAEVNVHVVSNGSSRSGSNIIYNSLPLKGQDTYVIDTEKLLLDNGDSIQATTNAGGNGNVVATCSFTSI